MRNAVLFTLIIVLGTSGELCIARAMQQVEGASHFSPRAILRVIGNAVRVRWLWGGLAMMATAFFALLTILSTEQVSFVVPVTAANYAVGVMGGMFFLGERITRQRWAGVLLICAGVSLVLIGR